MKRLVAILLVSVLLLGLFTACDMGNEDPGETVSTNAIPEELQGIDELTPENGVYSIVSQKGLQNMAEHPDASFVLLCDIDLGGAELAPVGTQSSPFSGSFCGNGFSISNFKLVSSDDVAGFFGYSTGTISELVLSDYELELTGSDVQAAGGLVAVNSGSIVDCKTEDSVISYSGAGDIALGSIVGRSENGTVENVEAATDLVIEPIGGSIVAGGLAGVSENDSFVGCLAAGRLLVTTDKADCVIGLFGGDMSGTTVTDSKYSGSLNTIDGKLFSDYTGNESDTTFEKCYWRDNTYSDDLLDEDESAMRQTVVDAMIEMGSYEWTPTKTLVYTCPDGDSYCSQIYIAGLTYYGLPYTHNWGNAERFLYCFNEDGSLKDWVPETGYDGWDMYMGNDCSGAVYWAWSKVSTSISFTVTSRQVPIYPEYGCIAVGDYDYSMSGKTDEIIDANGYDKIYECYSQLHKGDAFVGYNNAGYHHTRLVAEVFTYRTRDGVLDPSVSCVVGHGQGERASSKFATTWWLYHTETFEELIENRSFLPITIKEYAQGTAPEATVTLEGAIEGDGGLMTGTVSSNYSIIDVSVKITSRNKDVWDYTYFTGVTKYGDGTAPRSTYKEVNLSKLAVAMNREADLKRGKTYHAVITAHLSNGEDYIIKDTDFEW